MAGKFTNTTYKDTIDSLVSATKDKLNNPFYIFSDQRPTKVTYYSQNIEQSTMDQASGLYGAHVGNQSPFKFNKIKDFFLYGLEKINTEYDLGEVGIEAGEISGDAIVLPNTIIPRDGDFFSISYIKESVLFKVNGVSPDTLDNGANFYKIEYKLELTDVTDSIEAQVSKIFEFIPNHVGTDFKILILDCDYKLADEISAMTDGLISYFCANFFDSRLQTFVYSHDGWHMYDPFAIEFIIRNKVLSHSTDTYIHVAHATSTSRTFGIDYMKTFFNRLEGRDTRSFDNSATADLITDPNSLFVTRMDHYYKVRYNDKTPYKTRFNTIDAEVIEHIENGEKFERGNPKEIYNLWIAFMNNENDFITGNAMDLLRNMNLEEDNLRCFYMLIITIYILEQSINSLIKNLI